MPESLVNGASVEFVPTVCIPLRLAFIVRRVYRPRVLIPEGNVDHLFDLRILTVSEQSLITRTLIAINLLAFLATLFRGGSLSSGGGDVTIDFGLVGYGRVLSTFSIDYVGVAEGEWWRMVTGGFLHAGFIHLAFNMFLLWMLGSQLERILGATRYLTVGASGAVFGLMGATVIYQLRRGVSPWSNGIGTLLIINLIFTFARPNISVGGHLGGLLGGLLIGWLIDEINKKRVAGYLSFLVPLIITVALGFSCIWASEYWYDPILG